MDAREPFARRDTLCLPRATLLADGVTARHVAAAVHGGELIRARRGWYVLAQAPEPLLQAIRVGGRATCITALRSYGIWVPVAERSAGETTHIALTPGASRLRSPDDRRRPLLSGAERGAVLHWRPWDTGHRELWRTSLVDALAHAAWCVEHDHFVAILESALFEGRLGGANLAALVARSPRRRRQIFDRLDSRAESGTETLVRLALSRAGLSARPQVEIAGVGRVDLVVGDRVVVEVDSSAWHDETEARSRDYRRDLGLYRRGYIVVRVSWFQAMFRRREVVAAVAAAVASVRGRRQ